jgi:ribonucleoside-diphosphate reductase subunit M2
MAAEITPSKQVSYNSWSLLSRPIKSPMVGETDRVLQAASAIDSLKMESPVKKLDFGLANKENKPLDDDAVAALAAQVDAEHKPKLEETKNDEKPATAVVPSNKAHEVDEPLLQENPQRFVLFPIKYHEVRDACRRVKWLFFSRSILT